MEKIKIILVASLFLFVSTDLYAQKFTRDNYLDYLPSAPKIISQTAASDTLCLYGDPKSPDYEDVNPTDGIDDNRAERLGYLAAKFSPILRKNHYSSPQDFERTLKIQYEKKKKTINEDGIPFLFIDKWDVTGPSSLLIGSDSINLGSAIQSPDEVNDSKLKKLMLEFYPDSCKIQKIDPSSDFEKLLFFNFPGQDEKSWKEIYKRMTDYRSRIYAHFFVSENCEAKTERCLELVIQYWFFYFFNDGSNNHEGDWEHINVRITTQERPDGLLKAQDLQRILDHTQGSILDSLVISKVDYYFHHFVTTLDYTAFDFLQDEDKFKVSLQAKKENKVMRNWIYKQIYHRVHLTKDSPNTHPIGYIGANNKGFDQILSFPGGKNKNSHGTYPFPGTWKNIGPVGATEKLPGERTYQFLFPSIDRTKALGRIYDAGPKHVAVYNPDYVTYSKQDITLVPDWERIIELAVDDPEVRRKWFWLLLPIRWGFPVMASPGAGFIKHADLGNVSPVGPAYNSGWNRVGACRGFEEYDPHVLPSQFILDFPDNYNNSLGFLNLTLPTLISLPVFNVLWAFTGAQIEFNPKFYPKTEVPFRFSSLLYKPAYVIADHDFAKLLPKNDNAVVNAFFSSHPNSVIDAKSLTHENYYSCTNILLNFHVGDFTTENRFSVSNSNVNYKIKNAGEQSIGKVKGNLKYYELIGSLRFSFSKKNFQPFLFSGFGWNWFRLEDVRLNGSSVGISKTQWFNDPKFKFLPNTGHVGCGLEFIAKRNDSIQQKPLFGWLFVIGKPEVGVRFEYAFHFHRLGKDAPVNDWVHRHELGLGLVVSF